MANAVEDFVNHVQSLSSQGQFNMLCDYMNKTWNNLMKINTSLLDTILEALDLQEHSLGIMYVLCIKINTLTNTTSSDDFEQILSQVSLFVSQCTTEQIRYSSGNFAQMFHTITAELCRRNMSIRGLKLLSMAIEKLQMHSSQLTSIHADLCQMCLDAKCLRPALKFLDIEISEISKENGMFDAKHFLSYYYYGGMIYACMKNYSRSLYFFEQAISCPATTVSFIMLESYKK
jgi:COP9 signalosome complex subunit 3